ncbi:hypothetical protein DFQ04_1291 [Algoriphagus boseongensis]|uniref:DUF3575 domain-containing protein n=1 Tax=Algoriphagus boseongensis TaxID=1442587 RepID=A0A4R6T8U4_9BACT|nr:hypothetical protein [Algoriphagus boseongensis]TDQ19470.1 hypothetical protein DFQ04_1291 [Algoriphagus boseongensis]
MKNLLTFILMMVTMSAFAQGKLSQKNENAVAYKYRISTPGITVPQFFTKSWDDRTNTQHIELHVKRNLDNKNIIGLKLATWRLFQPMGILWWDGLLDKVESETEFYPGHVRETGIGISYQRMLWKGLFATVEVLPQYKTYLDEDNNKIGNGFKLYNSFHLGYHLAFGKSKRFFVEPQVHSQFWVFDTKTPDGFKQLDEKWRNYFLFEPNIYIGVKF